MLFSLLNILTHTIILPVICPFKFSLTVEVLLLEDELLVLPLELLLAGLELGVELLGLVQGRLQGVLVRLETGDHLVRSGREGVSFNNWGVSNS